MPKVRAKQDVYADGAYRERGEVFDHKDDAPDPNLERVHDEVPAAKPPPPPHLPNNPIARVKRE